MNEDILTESTQKAKSTINISGAGIQGGNKSANQETDFNKQNEDYLQNVLDQKVILNANVGKPDPNATTTIDFLDETQVNNLTASKTKVSENKSADDFFKGKTTDQIQSQLKAEEEKSKQVSPETFVEIARFIIFLIDASAAAFFRWWSGDQTDTAYSLSKPKQEQLVRQLATILIKYQAKFSIEFMFLISVLILYIPAFTLAKGNRKENKNKKKNETVRPTQTITHKTTTYVPPPVVEVKRTKASVNPIEEEIKVETNHNQEIITTVLEPEIIDLSVLPVAKPAKRTTRPRKAN